MTRTTPTKPLDDQKMWRRILADFHPDRRPDKKTAHEDFVFLAAVKETVCDGQARRLSETPPRNSHHQSTAANSDTDRIPYPSDTVFREATLKALRYANAHDDGYGQLLRLVEDCYPMSDMWREQERGASYKRLAAIGYMAGMNVAQRSRWYEIARSIPLSDRHASHILGRLKRRAA